MRKIEFKGYDPDTKRWYYGQYVREEQSTGYALGYDWDKHEREKVKHFIYFTQSGDWGMPTSKHRATVDPESVGQWTGLLDKNNKRIYEGDLVRFDLGEFEVVIESSGVGVRDRLGEWQGRLSHRLFETEIVGNKYKETQ